jgi:hypothetical protein
VTEVVFDVSVSLDGFLAGPDATLEQPLGAGGRSAPAAKSCSSSSRPVSSTSSSCMSRRCCSAPACRSSTECAGAGSAPLIGSPAAVHLGYAVAGSR